MGWRVRKSIKLGRNTRLNINKKGFSVSTGVKGARVTVNNKGKVTRTVGIPGTGIYNTKQYDLNKKKKQSKNVPNNIQAVKTNRYVPPYLKVPGIIELINHGFKIKKAINAYNAGDKNKCFKLSEEVLEVWSDCSNAKAFTAMKLYRMKQYKEVIDILESLPNEYKEDPDLIEILDLSRFYVQRSGFNINA